METVNRNKLDMIINAGRGSGGGIGRGIGRGRGGMERGRGLPRGRGRGRGNTSSFQRGRGGTALSRASSNHSESNGTNHEIQQRNKNAEAEAQTESDSEVESEASTSTSTSSSSSSSSNPQAEILSRTFLNLSSNPLPPREALINTLSKFKALRKIEITNVPKSIDWPNGLDELGWLKKSCRKSKKENGNTQGKGKGKEKPDEEQDEQQAFGDVLTTLNVSGNELGRNGDQAWKGLEIFRELFAINATHCSLSQLPNPLLSITSLKALVLSHNSLTTLPSIFPLLPNLNTLILSHNSISKIPPSLPASLPSLKKLGLSFNKLSYPIPSSASLSEVSKSSSSDKVKSKPKGREKSPQEIQKEIDAEWVDFTMCSHLREIRLNSNPDLETLPNHIVNWGKGLDSKSVGLEILDLGDCALLDWRSIEPLLKLEDLLFKKETKEKKKVPGNEAENGQEETEMEMKKNQSQDENQEKKGENKSKKKGLAQLNLKGNPVSLLPSYKEKVTLAHPTLRVLDNQRLSEKLPSRQEARAIIKAARKERRELAKLQRKQEIQDGSNSQERSQEAYGKRRGKQREIKHDLDDREEEERSEQEESGDEIQNFASIGKDAERRKLKHKRAGRRTKKNKDKNQKGEGDQQGQQDEEKSKIRARAGPPPGSSVDDEPMLGVESDDEMITPVQDQDQDQDEGDDVGEKKRKRGKRGKKATSWMTGGETVVFNDDDDDEGSGDEEADKALGSKSIEKKTKKRKRERGVDEEEGSEKEKSKNKKTKPQPQPQPQPAWDEGSEVVKPSLSLPLSSLSKPQRPVEEVDQPNQAPTGIAGVVNVKRKSNSKGTKLANVFNPNTASDTFEPGAEDAWGNSSAWD